MSRPEVKEQGSGLTGQGSVCVGGRRESLEVGAEGGRETCDCPGCMGWCQRVAGGREGEGSEQTLHGIRRSRSCQRD